MERPHTTAGAGSDTASRRIKIDAEHFSIRFLLPVLTVVLVLVVHFGGIRLLDSVMGETNPLCIVLPADLLALFVGSTLIERGLKLVLPSRRSALLTDEALTVTDARQDPHDITRIAWDETFTVRAWRFEVGRRGRRVPRGWYCMALQLLQDEEDVILYAFMPQAQAEDVTGFDNFVRLRPRKETQSNTDLNAVAEQRRLLKLEDRRWEDGAEIAPADFAAILARLKQVFPGWAR